MSSHITSEQDFGRPALRIAGLGLWIHGRESPDSDHYYDGNWLQATAECHASGSRIKIQGPFLMATDIAAFGEQCESLLQGKSRSAKLDPLEPDLSVSLEAADSLGHILVRVEITPDHLRQSHSLEFEIDQSYLPGIIKQCRAVALDYPVRGDR